MAKNLIPIIAKELGVEIGEEFKLKYNDNSVLKNCEKERIFRFTDAKLEEQDYYRDDVWNGAYAVVDLLVYGTYEVVKLPFEPKMGEKYWTYDIGWRIDNWCWANNVEDYCRKACDMVFRTKEEAIAALPAKCKELTGKEWK